MPPETSSTVLGHAVHRTEDPALLTGAARFVGDRQPPGLLHAVFVRSTAVHGVLRDVDVAAARDAAGVAGAWTAADLHLEPQAAFGGEPELARPVLASGRV